MTPDIQLSPHFTLRELTRSDTATRLGIDNSLDPSNPKHQPILENLRNLCTHVLEPLRSFANSIVDGNTSPRGGRKEIPILINSGYRCPALNKAVGGVPNSQHLTGQAADIRIPYIPGTHTQDLDTATNWYNYLMSHDFDQLIWEQSTPNPTPNNPHPPPTYWIHVSWAPLCRHIVMSKIVQH